MIGFGVSLTILTGCGSDTDGNAGDIVVRDAPVETAVDAIPLRSDTADRLTEPLALPGPGGGFRQNRPDAADTIASEADLPAPGRWTEVVRLDPTIALDLRYATDSNFVGERMYRCPRCFLRPGAARSLAALQGQLREQGLGLKLFDCYRPLDVQWRLWRKVPDRRYVADPRKGSQHNRGVAADLTLVRLATGEELDMGTAYDYFGGEAWHRATPGFPSPIRDNRERLLTLMEDAGWRRTNSEWWHYSWREPGGAAIAEEEWACETEAPAGVR